MQPKLWPKNVQSKTRSQLGNLKARLGLFPTKFDRVRPPTLYTDFVHLDNIVTTKIIKLTPS